MRSIEARLLALAEDVIGLTDLDEFRVGLLEALRRAVPSDYASLNDLGPEPDDATVIGIPEPALTPESLEAFVRHRDENPIARYFARTRDGRANRFSDLITRRELRALALCQHVYAPLGIEHQIAFTLPTSPNRLLAVALIRTDHNYTNRERELLNRARPLLIQAFRKRDRPARAADQAHTHTRRDRHDQRADQRRAHRPRSADHPPARARPIHTRHRHHPEHQPPHRRQHLERCFGKLDVNTQSTAAAKAWALSD